MTPVKPMLAEACKSVEHAFKKCPNGMFSEIKYDGERVQVLLTFATKFITLHYDMSFFVRLVMFLFLDSQRWRQISVF